MLGLKPHLCWATTKVTETVTVNMKSRISNYNIRIDYAVSPKIAD